MDTATGDCTIARKEREAGTAEIRQPEAQTALAEAAILRAVGAVAEPNRKRWV
jgi:hypothetical protein